MSAGGTAHGRRSPSDPVSVAITRRVRPDRVGAFEAWLDEIKVAARGFEGYAGMDVVRPADPSETTYVIILRFDRHENYTTWHGSARRSELVERASGLTVGEGVFEEASGLEGWFTPASGPGTRRPARYKMTILTIVGLYPLIVGVGALVGAATDLATPVATLVIVFVVAVLATYLVMPWITRSARLWLYPDST